MKIELRTTPYDPYAELAAYQQQINIHHAGGYGASTIFIGSMRDVNEGDEVSSMFLEHYPGMTESSLCGIAERAKQEYALLDIMILHRVGEVRPHDVIVLVAVWSAHRAESFTACRYIMEELKSNVPFWKKETLSTGTRWVNKNTPG